VWQEQEQAMWMPFKWFTAWVKRDSDPAGQNQLDEKEAVKMDVSTCADFQAAWHGDHWQNLLSSPMMGGRSYVCEDWTSEPTDYEEPLGSLSGTGDANGRRTRGRRK
jgi:hypothetical protein